MTLSGSNAITLNDGTEIELRSDGHAATIRRRRRSSDFSVADIEIATHKRNIRANLATMNERISSVIERLDALHRRHMELLGPRRDRNPKGR